MREDPIEDTLFLVIGIAERLGCMSLGIAIVGRPGKEHVEVRDGDRVCWVSPHTAPSVAENMVRGVAGLPTRCLSAEVRR